MVTDSPVSGIPRRSGRPAAADGPAVEIAHRASPSHGPRREGARPDLVVLHYTAMESEAAALERLSSPRARVSAHYLIGAGGRVTRIVPEDLRAWHAGAGRWAEVGDVNSRSVGIELDNDGASPFPEPQMEMLERLLRAVMARWGIPPERVIAHSDMAPERKGDPGVRFDWRRLARRGLSVWPRAGAAPAPDFAAAARRFGYPDLSEEVLLAAFRLRFRPGAEGPLDATDRALIADLAERFPVDRAMQPA